MKIEVVYGIHAVDRFLKQTPENAIELAFSGSNQRLRELVATTQALGIDIRQVSRDDLTDLSGSDKHQGCVLVIRADSKSVGLDSFLANLDKKSLFLVLDGVQDPHNLGACLRTADAAGVDAVIVPKQRAARITASVRKVAAGAAESMPVIEVPNISRCLESLKQAGVWVFGACGEAKESIYQHRFDTATALVMGGEGDGLRRLTRENCDYLVSLPLRGQVESLNVSVATGICLYEIQRARGACEGT